VITSNASCGGIGSPYMRIQWPIRIKLHRECGWTHFVPPNESVEIHLCYAQRNVADAVMSSVV
jgi:hypothetical protein